MNASVRVTNITGNQGSVVIDDTTAKTPTAPYSAFQAIQVLEEAAISAITAPGIINAAGLVGVALQPGTIIYGAITSITLTSGKVIAYHA